jgi:hypothetical protein
VLVNQLQAFAFERNFALDVTATGFVTVPLRDSHRLSDEEIAQLPDEQQRAFQRRADEIEHAIRAMMGKMRELDKAAEERKRQLDRDVAAYTVGPLLDELRDRYREHPDVLAYLDQVQRDVPEHLADFRSASATEAEEPDLIAQILEREPGEALARYRVNVLVDQRQPNGAPVVVERNPTYANLIGRLEFRATFGAMATDFQHITPGALHRANGGFPTRAFVAGAQGITRLDGPPRVIALGFQLTNGKLIGPWEMFDDPGFDEARHMCNIIAEHLRRHGPFEPHRLPMEEMEYTTLPEVMVKLAERWQGQNGRARREEELEVVPT